MDIIDIVSSSEGEEKPHPVQPLSKRASPLRVQPARLVKFARMAKTPEPEHSHDPIEDSDEAHRLSIQRRGFVVAKTESQASNVSQSPHSSLTRTIVQASTISEPLDGSITTTVQSQDKPVTSAEAISQSTEVQATNAGSELLSEWKKIEDQLRCDICKQLLDVPVSLKCFHTFCSFCIRRYLELSGNDYCPSCRIPASSTDIRLEPRLASILTIIGKDRGILRKKLRFALRSAVACPEKIDSKNETFNKQADLAELFKTSSISVGRTLLPLYKNLKDKALRDLIMEDGLDSLLENPSLPRDELIKVHKEFVFTLQAAHDAVRMGMYPENFPTKAGLAKAFNTDYRLRTGKTLIRQTAAVAAVSKRRAAADRNGSVAELTRQAGARMADQLRQAVAKHRRTNPSNENLAANSLIQS